MPGNPSIDRLETLECVERNGVVRRLVRTARVMGMTGWTDYRVLWQGLAKAGIPAWGTGLVDSTNLTNFANTQAFNTLVLIQRDAKIAEQDPGTVDVILTYEHLLDGPNQGLKFPGSNTILYTKSRSSVVQKPTNFFYPYGQNQASTAPINILEVSSLTGPGSPVVITVAAGTYISNGTSITISGLEPSDLDGTWIVTALGNGQFILNGSAFSGDAYTGGQLALTPGTLAPRIQILVGHKYALDDSNFPGQIQIQGGEISLPFPQENLRLEGYIYTANPRAIKRAIHRMVNAVQWLEDNDQRCWLCSEVQFDILDPKPVVFPAALGVAQPLYRFEFEFQYDPDTWDQTVTFKDSRTGLPPADVVLGYIPDPNAPDVQDQQEDDITAETFPAGWWTVPALPQTDFNAFFAAYFDGNNGNP